MSPADVLREMESTMAMKPGEWLEDELRKSSKITIIDLRSRDAWKKEHIRGSIQISLQELPDRIASVIPDKSSTVVCLCNGSVQSAMAIVFLRAEGYSNSYNLSGGFSAWMRNERPVE